MNALVQSVRQPGAPRSHRAPRHRVHLALPHVPRAAGVLGAALCCTAGLMGALYVVSTKVA